MTDRFPVLTHDESAALWARAFHKAILEGADAGYLHHPLRLHKRSFLKSPQLATLILERSRLGEHVTPNIYPHMTKSDRVYLGFIQEWDYTTTVNTPCFVGVSS